MQTQIPRTYYQTHDVFSKNDQDIGKAEHFQHTILLKDNKPRFLKQYPIRDAHRPEVEAQIQDWLKIGYNSTKHFQVHLTNVHGTQKWRILESSPRLQETKSS
jgi:hypothetical protein